MAVIAVHPYSKQFIFPCCSFTFLVRVVFLVATLGAPFFLTYSTPNFYLPSQLGITLRPSIAPTYQYSILILTTAQSYSYTNMYVSDVASPISIESTLENSTNTFSIRWNRPSVEKILSVRVGLLYSYSYKGVSSNVGAITASVSGSDICSAAIHGYTSIKSISSGAAPLTTPLPSFDIDRLIELGYYSSSYLEYHYNALPVNMPCDSLALKVVVDMGGYSREWDTPSILSQMVWSWLQYCPIMLVIYWGCKQAFLFLLREGILPSKVLHDPQYIQPKLRGDYSKKIIIR